MTTEHPEIITVDPGAKDVSCDGGGALGHPRVWYSFDGRDEIVCGYCDRLFTKKAQSKKAGKKGGKGKAAR